jgi:hypothetical protein
VATTSREIQALEAFAALDDPKGEPVGILAVVHRRKP